MFDEDLEALHGMLRRMEPDESIQIGDFTCVAGELFWVVEEAMAARVQAKDAGTFQPYTSVVSDYPITEESNDTHSGIHPGQSGRH